MAAEVDPDFVPPQAERDRVLSTLATLVEAGGYEALALGPLLEPTPAFFPDPWRGGPASLAQLLRRLLLYADLSSFDVAVEIVDPKDASGAMAPAGPGSAVWFDHQEGERLTFMARPDGLADPSTLVPAAARAVTEAWRRVHGLELRDANEEQRACDLTSVYLGFGVLMADAALRHGASRTDTLRLQRTVRRVGVTPPQSLCFALAVVLTVRGEDEAALRRLAKSLQPNPRAFLRASMTMLAGRRSDLLERLGIVPVEQWDDPVDPRALASLPLDAVNETELDDTPPPADRGVLGMNAGRPIFRVERSKALRWGKLLALPTVMLGMLAGRMPMLGIELPMWQVMLAAAGLGASGLAIGRLVPDRRCSEPKCGRALAPSDTVCTRCGGHIVGVIHHPKERLAAEDAYLAEQKAALASNDASAPAQRA